MASLVPIDISDPNHANSNANFIMPIYEGDLNVMKSTHWLGKSVRLAIISSGNMCDAMVKMFWIQNRERRKSHRRGEVLLIIERGTHTLVEPFTSDT